MLLINMDSWNCFLWQRPQKRLVNYTDTFDYPLPPNIQFFFPVFRGRWDSWNA